MKNLLSLGKYSSGFCLGCLTLVFFSPALPLAAFDDVLPAAELEGTLESIKLADIFEQYLATMQVFDPERATRMGVHAADPYLTLRTREREAQELKALRGLHAKLMQLNKSLLSTKLQADYEVFDNLLQVDIYELANLDLLGRRPQDYLEPVFLIFQMMNKDYEDYSLRGANALARLKQLPAVLEQAERNLTRPPELWTRQAIKNSLGHVKYISDFAAIFKDYTRDDQLLKTQVEEAVEKAKAAFARYAAFLEKNILPVSDGNLSSGKAVYGFYLRGLHSLNISPASAYSRAEKSFKTSLKELKKEALAMDAMLAKEKGWKGVLEKLPKEHPPVGEVMKVFQDEIDRAYKHFDEHKFVDFPQQPLLIKRTPNFMASVLPYVYYSPAFALDQTSIPELFVLLPPETASDEVREKSLALGFNYAQIELLTAYSIMPGMHLRKFKASGNLSKIRQVSRQPIVANGWACYAELLAEEMGFYSSPWSRFLRCYIHLLRSARAYADAALHTNKWTPEKASEFFQDQLFMSRVQADGEVVKLSMAPTIGFSYVYGLERILDLRRAYQRAEKESFDLRQFHSLFMQLGEISIGSIEREIINPKSEKRK